MLGGWFQKLACVTLEKLFDASVFSSVSGDNNTSLIVRIKLIIIYKALFTLGIESATSVFAVIITVPGT